MVSLDSSRRIPAVQRVAAPRCRPRFDGTSSIFFHNTFANADVNASFAAWVNVSSIRSADQQDALLASGFVQLTHEVKLGTAHTLPIGTFVFGGSGLAGATKVFLTPAQGGANATVVAPTTAAFTMPTPDAILVFVEPPVSCESVAFYYSLDGQPLTAAIGAGGLFGGSTTTGPFKTMAQMNVYECSPFKPGLFFSQTGSNRQPNQFLEGQDITIDLNPVADANGNFGIVTIGTGESLNLTIFSVTAVGSSGGAVDTTNITIGSQAPTGTGTGTGP